MIFSNILADTPTRFACLSRLGPRPRSHATIWTNSLCDNKLSIEKASVFIEKGKKKKNMLSKSVYHCIYGCNILSYVKLVNSLNRYSRYNQGSTAESEWVTNFYGNGKRQREIINTRFCKMVLPTNDLPLIPKSDY